MRRQSVSLVLQVVAFFFFAAQVCDAAPLHDAAKKGDLASVKELVRAGSEIDAPDGNGKSALHLAAEGDHPDIIQYLAANGADPNRFATGFYSGRTAPIHAAVRLGNLEAVRALAAAGANLWLPAYSDGAPLHMAVSRDQQDMAALLISFGAENFSAAPVEDLIAKADPAKGEVVATPCASCHALAQGVEPPGAGYGELGPPLRDILGRGIADYPGYTYSSAMQDRGGVWDYATLNNFLANPTAFVPGTNMLVSPIQSTEDRAALIAYLRTLTDDPVPLP